MGSRLGTAPKGGEPGTIEQGALKTHPCFKFLVWVPGTIGNRWELFIYEVSFPFSLVKNFAFFNRVLESLSD